MRAGLDSGRRNRRSSSLTLSVATAGAARAAKRGIELPDEALLTYTTNAISAATTCGARDSRRAPFHFIGKRGTWAH